MDDGAKVSARARTVNVTVRDDVEPAVLEALSDCQLTQQPGTIRISARIDSPEQTYQLLDRIRQVGMTLIGVSVDMRDQND